MEFNSRFKLLTLLGVIVVLASYIGSISAMTQKTQKETGMAKRASGTFEVKIKPVDDKIAEGLGRMMIEKQLHGDFEGSSSGQMLTAMTSVQGSAVYVALERLTGTLQGRKGSFVLHHTGIMNKGAQQLTINVVPDSGTDQLTGLTGAMTIKIADAKHFYEFDYTLPDQP